MLRLALDVCTSYAHTEPIETNNAQEGKTMTFYDVMIGGHRVGRYISIDKAVSVKAVFDKANGLEPGESHIQACTLATSGRRPYASVKTVF